MPSGARHQPPDLARDDPSGQLTPVASGLAPRHKLGVSGPCSGTTAAATCLYAIGVSTRQHRESVEMYDPGTDNWTGDSRPPPSTWQQPAVPNMALGRPPPCHRGVTAPLWAQWVDGQPPWVPWTPRPPSEHGSRRAVKIPRATMVPVQHEHHHRHPHYVTVVYSSTLESPPRCTRPECRYLERRTHHRSGYLVQPAAGPRKTGHHRHPPFAIGDR